MNVVMVGPKGAGKTSILSVMLYDIEQFIAKLVESDSRFRDLRVRPSLEALGQAHETLKAGHQQLNNLVLAAQRTGEGATSSVDMTEGRILGDSTFRSSTVVFRMGDVATEMNFCDFPGGFYSSAYLDRNKEREYAFISAEEIEQWEEIVRRADVILLAVDASTQLGENPFLQDKSYYSRITQLVKESIETSRTTLVFVPVKCEHIALNPAYDAKMEEIETPFSSEGCRTLRKEVTELFPELIEFVREPSNWGKVNAFFIPMITVGGIKCNGRQYNPATNSGTIRFSPILQNHYGRTPFRPQNCDKVFAICLLQIYGSLVEAWKGKGIFEKLESGIRAVTSYTSDCLPESLRNKVPECLRCKTPFWVFFDKLAKRIQLDRMVQSYPNYQENKDGCVALNGVSWPIK